MRNLAILSLSLLAFGLALVAPLHKGSAAEQSMPIFTGEPWQQMSPDSKIAFV